MCLCVAGGQRYSGIALIGDRDGGLKSRGLHSIMRGHLEPLGAPHLITETVQQSRAGPCDTQRGIVAVRPVPDFGRVLGSVVECNKR